MAEKKSEIRIYPSFTEVREDVKATAPYVIYLSSDLFNQITSNSLSLEGVKVLSMNTVSKDTNLEGKILHVHKENSVKQVKVIRGRDLLVQDLETQRYFNVGRDQLEFTEIPEESGTEITFVLEKEGDAVLSYLMYGINWRPRYNFNIQNDSHEFEGWADINNNTQREYVIDKTELFGGDVSLTRPKPRAQYAMAMCDSAPYALKKSAPKIQSEGEKSGLYSYAINDKYVLEPRSTFSLPFVTPKIKLEKLVIFNNYFCQSLKKKGKFTRVYRISSDVFLPNGSVTVREDNRVVGQGNIPDLTVDESFDLSLGNDPDVSFEREANSLEVNSEFSQYEIEIKISNSKNRDVNFEFNESIGSRNEIVSREPNNLVFKDNNLKHEGVLSAGQSVSIKYVIKLYFN